MASEAEARAEVPSTALAPRPETGALEPRRTLPGGAGLFSHSDRDALSARGGALAGVLGLVVTVGIAKSGGSAN